MDSTQRATVALPAMDSSGEWIAHEDMCQSALKIFNGNDNVQISLDPGLHLDASALQILLSLFSGLTKDGRTMTLTDVSLPMEKWFGYAGATALLEATRPVAAADKVSA